jgi:hypothetical protein
VPTSLFRGGLRLTLYGDQPPSAEIADLHTGDRVEVLVKAQPPRNFNDPGAFGAKDYLASPHALLAEKPN